MLACAAPKTYGKEMHLPVTELKITDARFRHPACGNIAATAVEVVRALRPCLRHGWRECDRALYTPFVHKPESGLQ